MEFATDRYCVCFKGVRIFVEDYSFSRNAAIGETVLSRGGVVFHNGGGRAVRINLSGKSESNPAHILDELLLSGEAFDIEYEGIIFSDVVLISYTCKGRSGESAEITAEFISVEQLAEKAVEE